MAEQPVVIQSISWRELCPWTVIFRVLPIACSVSVVTLALVGVLASCAGWWLLELVLVNDTLREQTSIGPLAAELSSPSGTLVASGKEAIGEWGSWAGPQDVFIRLVEPVQSLFDRRVGMRGFCYLFCGAVWSLLVWSFLGLAICRIGLVRLTRNEFVPLDEACAFALEKWTTVVGAIGVPLVAVFALCIPTFLLGLLMTFNLGASVVAVGWLVVLALAGAMAVLLLGLMFGWPLMVSSVACESQNSFDAMTRSYAYTFQRPFHYLFYAILAVVFGGLSWMVASAIVEGVVELGYWSTSWGANVGSADRIDQLVAGPSADDSGKAVADGLGVARGGLAFWNGALRAVATSFLYGLFWSLAGAIYLLLRKDVDETEMDEIVIREEERQYQLPPLQSDEQGIPQIRPLEQPAESESGDSPSRDPDAASGPSPTA